jgi:DNA-binding PadR family transcriptional regulator
MLLIEDADAMSRAVDPRSFLPLSPLVFQVLVALADGPRHGYGVIQEIDVRTGGLIRLRTGTLYLLLQRLTADALVEPTKTPKSQSSAAGRAPGSPRRYYGLTPLGGAVLVAETRRLETAVSDARAKRVLFRA